MQIDVTPKHLVWAFFGVGVASALAGAGVVLLLTVKGNAPETPAGSTTKHPRREVSVSKIDPGAWESPSDRTPAKGRPVPEFEVEDLQGKRWRLADLQGKIVLLNFWATWCVPCKTEMPHLDRLARRFAPQGLVVLGLAVDTDLRAVEKFFETVRVGYPIALAETSLQQTFGGIPGLPTTFLIDRGGILRHHVIGYSTEEELDEALRPLL